MKLKQYLYRGFSHILRRYITLNSATLTMLYGAVLQMFLLYVNRKSKAVFI